MVTLIEVHCKWFSCVSGVTKGWPRDLSTPIEKMAPLPRKLNFLIEVFMHFSQRILCRPRSNQTDLISWYDCRLISPTNRMIHPVVVPGEIWKNWIICPRSSQCRDMVFIAFLEDLPHGKVLDGLVYTLPCKSLSRNVDKNYLHASQVNPNFCTIHT